MKEETQETALLYARLLLPMALVGIALGIILLRKPK